MNWFQKLYNWLICVIFPRAVKRVITNHAMKKACDELTPWEIKLQGGRTPPKRCVNRDTGQPYYEYGNKH